MKRIVQFSFLFLTFLILLPFTVAAQDEKTNTISITITEGGEVTTDTTFELSEGQDPDAVKEIVEELAGGDLHFKVAKDGHKKVMYIKEDEEWDTWHIHDINVDSIKEAYEGAHVMVMKTDDGNVKVKVWEDEEEDFEFESDEGKSYKVKVIKEGNEEDDDETKVKVFVSEDDEVMFIEGDEELEWVEEDNHESNVIIIKSDDGKEVIVKKKIRVEVSEGDLNEEKDEEVKVKKEKKTKKKQE